MRTPDAEPFNPKPRRKKPVRETGRGGIEQAGRAAVKARGGLSLKWVSPGTSGVPDQIELYGADGVMALLGCTWERAVEIIAAALQMTEYKAPGKEPTPHQLRMHARLRARGFTVNVIDHFPKEKP